MVGKPTRTPQTIRRGSSRKPRAYSLVAIRRASPRAGTRAGIELVTAVSPMITSTDSTLREIQQAIGTEIPLQAHRTVRRDVIVTDTPPTVSTEARIRAYTARLIGVQHGGVTHAITVAHLGGAYRRIQRAIRQEVVIIATTTF